MQLWINCLLTVRHCSLSPNVSLSTVNRTSVRPCRDSAVRTFCQWITYFYWKNISSDTSEDIVNNFVATIPKVKSVLRYNDKPWMSIRIKQLVKKSSACFHTRRFGEMALFTQQGTTTNNQSPNQFLQ